MIRTILFLAGLAAAWPAAAALNVFACEPEWAALAKELGGDKVSTYSATHALQDPHRVEARPSLIAKARSARLVVCTGAELEAGWLPPVLRESGNAAVQPGRPGYFEAAQFVTRLEIPARLDRSEGDVHAAGNPHIQLDPRNLLAVAAPLAKRLGELDAANAGHYAEGHQAFAEKMRQAIARWEQAAAPLKGMRVIAQHRSFSYLFNWLGLVEAGTLEPKPGIEPGSAHLAQLVAQAKTQQVRLIVRTPFDSPRPGEWLAERAGIPLVILPFTVGGSERAQDLFGLFDDTLVKLKGAP
ncbi:MAG: zinc ABC transporter substrate-binding protein [Denitratisoma sp.]|nr:zinc ABC transporter substrate-binding protein [Denitratisoma sp.]